MSSLTLDTPYLHDLIRRWQAGERAAAEELLGKVAASFAALVRRMVRGYPHLRAHLETSDVYQGAVQRLLRTLQQFTPTSTAHFLSLLAVHIRRELIDLTRHYANRNHAPLVADVAQSSSAAPEALERWTRFHEAIGSLPDDERAVLDLVFYQGCTQAQVVEVLGISERTVRRRWQAACLKLNDRLAGEFPLAGE